MAEIVEGGDLYIPITQEQYNRLCEAKEASEKVRFIAVENFRVWCEANKGVSTVEEGLAVCTPEELQAQYYAAGGYSPVPGTLIPDYISMLVARLKDRREQAQDALAKVPVTPIMPPEEEEDDDSAAHND